MFTKIKEELNELHINLRELEVLEDNTLHYSYEKLYRNLADSNYDLKMRLENAQK